MSIAARRQIEVGNAGPFRARWNNEINLTTRAYSDRGAIRGEPSPTLRLVLGMRKLSLLFLLGLTLELIDAVPTPAHNGRPTHHAEFASIFRMPDALPSAFGPSGAPNNRLFFASNIEKEGASPPEPVPAPVEELDFDEEFEAEFGRPADSKISDPLSGYNRFMTGVNDKFYFWVLKPAAVGYGHVVPRGLRIAISRFFDNLLFPVRFVNNLLQFKFKGAGVELARFGINSTLGLAGLEDPAQEFLALNPHREDFGQTLGYYGVGGGFHLVLPIFGPSNLRDTFGFAADTFLDPLCYVGSCYFGYWEAVLGVRSYKTLNYGSLHIGEYESIKKDAFDLYLFLRDAYEQTRAKAIEE